MFDIKIPFHRYWFTDAEYEAVARIMRSGWLTTGQETALFETEFARYKNAAFALGVSSCTAGLELLLATQEIPPGSEIITSPYSFVATAHIILRAQARPVFVDIDPNTLNINPSLIEPNCNDATVGIIPVHIAGNMCYMSEITSIANQHRLFVVEDCAHAIESSYNGKASGNFGIGGSFSFYPNKNITCGEGGMITCTDEKTYHKLKRLRTHGLDRDALARLGNLNFQQYDVTEAGLKCNMTDLQAALGRCQLDKIETMWLRRKKIAELYNDYFADSPLLNPIVPPNHTRPAHHLYIVRLDLERLRCGRTQVIELLAQQGIQTSVHFFPIHLFSYYRERFGFKEGMFPEAEKAASCVLSLPFYPLLTDTEVNFVAETLLTILGENQI